MARPPSTDEAPNALAAYMRAYRAWKSGRGAKPAGRAQFIGEFDIEALAADLELRELYREIERHDFGRGTLEVGWADLRDAILEHGGIRPTVGTAIDHLSVPAPVYRLHGKPVDLMVSILADYESIYFEDGAELIAECWRRFDAVKRHREAA